MTYKFFASMFPYCGLFFMGFLYVDLYTFLELFPWLFILCWFVLSYFYYLLVFILSYFIFYCLYVCLFSNKTQKGCGFGWQRSGENLGAVEDENIHQNTLYEKIFSFCKRVIEKSNIQESFFKFCLHIYYRYTHRSTNDLDES